MDRPLHRPVGKDPVGGSRPDHWTTTGFVMFVGITIGVLLLASFPVHTLAVGIVVSSCVVARSVQLPLDPRPLPESNGNKDAEVSALSR